MRDKEIKGALYKESRRHRCSGGRLGSGRVCITIIIRCIDVTVSV